MRLYKRFLCLALSMTMLLGAMTVHAHEAGTSDGAQNSNGNYQGMPAGVPPENVITRYGVGYRFYICPDLSKICVDGHLIAADAAAGVLDELAANSKVMWGNIPATSVNMWNYATGSATTISNDPSGVRGIPGLSGFNIVGTDFLGATYSSVLDAAFQGAGDEATFRQICSYFGVSLDDVSHAAIVCEPFYVCASQGDSILFAVTYQQARSGAAAGRGGAGAFHWMRQPGTSLNSLTDWSGDGSNGFTCKIHKLGDIWQTIAPGGAVADSTRRSANSGYHFYGPGVGNPPPETPSPPVLETEEADLVLDDYELNHMYESVFEQKRNIGNRDWLKIRGDMWSCDPNSYTVVSDECTSRNSYDTTKHYDVVVSESTASGPIVSKDNGLGTDKVILKRVTNKRSEWKAGVTYNTEGMSPQVIDYSINLTRDLFADARVYSNFSPQTCSTDWLQTILGLTADDKVVTKAIVLNKRNSKQLLDRRLDDSFTWRGVYKITGGTTQWDTEDAHANDCGGHGGDEDGHGKWYHSGVDYKAKKNNGVPGILIPGDGETRPAFKLDVHSIAYKYQTEPMPPGVSNKTKERLTMVTTSKGNGADKVPTPYKYSLVRPTGVTIKYFPEVPMLTGVTPGPTWTPPEFKTVKTIGEEQRSSLSSMLCIYRIISDSSYDVKGTCYSDTSVGGSAGLGSQSAGRVALTAGGDFTVKSDTRLTLNLYGYAIDVVDKTDSEWASRFNSVDVKGDWGNGNTKNELLGSYMDWVTEMLRPKNYQADFTMKLGGKVYNTFSATVGGFTSTPSQSREDGVYYLSFKHGALEHDDQYTSLVNKIKDDYGDADDLWAMSTIETAVTNAIEHDKSAANKSQAQVYGAGVAQLGDSTHWYDEEVRTIVVRRFYTPPAAFKDIIAHDKMDLGTASANFDDFNGSFDLTLYFSNSNITCLEDIELYGDANSVGDTLENSLNRSLASGGVVIQGVHVKGADFRVTQSTTATGNH